MTGQNSDHVTWFRNSAPYINANRNKVVVLMLDGEAIAGDRVHAIIHDIALLVSLGIKLVLVHGARPQIAARLEQQDITATFHQDIRITDADTLACVKEAVGAVRSELEALLSMGLANSPMHGAGLKVCGGNFITAKPIGVRDGVDFQHTGDIRRIDSSAINRHLEDGSIVLLPPLGYSPTGEVFNLFSEQLATETAVALRADKLILMCGPEGVCNERGELISELSTNQAGKLLESNQLPQDIQRHLQAACDACHAGIPRAHLVSYRQDGALLTELYTRDGAGTLVTVERYEQVRQASIKDVSGIIALIRPLEKQGVLVRRSRELLEAEIEQFTVIERDGTIIGCAALYPFMEQNDPTGELACVAVHPDYRSENRGDQLLNHIISSAQQKGLKKLIVLTTQTAHWFLERGFVKSQLEKLPDSKQALYNWQRNSSIFEKTL